MPPKFKPEEFAELLLDSLVMAAVIQTLSPLLSASIEESITKHFESMVKKLNDLQTENTRLQVLTVQ